MSAALALGQFERVAVPIALAGQSLQTEPAE